MKLSTTLSLLTVGVLVTGGLVMGQEEMPDPTRCRNLHNLTQTTVLIGPQLSTFPAYTTDLAGGNLVGYGVFPTRDKHFYTSLPIGTCKLCKDARVTVRVRRDRANLGPNGNNNDQIYAGIARPGSPTPYQLFVQQIWTQAESNPSNPVLSKSLTFTIQVAALNDIIFHSANQGFLNFYVQDDTTVDSISIAYYTW